MDCGSVKFIPQKKYLLSVYSCWATIKYKETSCVVCITLLISKTKPVLRFILFSITGVLI